MEQDLQALEGWSRVKLVVRSFLLGTLLADVAIFLVMAIFAPGDAGTMVALAQGGIFLFLVPIILVPIGAVAYPLAALATWPLRDSMIAKPALSLLIAASGGGLAGFVISFLFATHWFSSQLPGIVAGSVYSVCWVRFVWKYASRTPVIAEELS